jgi:CHAT domain-containing protein
MAEMDRGPAVLHFGTHVLPNPAAPEQVMIALGLRPTGSSDYLAPADLLSIRKRVGLVTLSGCDSGSGRAYAGLGIQGLTRAWLLAGANAVVATYWPIPDDDGELLSAMYQELSKSGGTGPREVANALHLAQQKMASSSGWQSNPSYWGAFFVAGKE